MSPHAGRQPSHAGLVVRTPAVTVGIDADPALAAYIGQRVETIPTPCLVVDVPRLEANIERWQRSIEQHGKLLRPHIKTHKSPEIAWLQERAGANGIAVAKVAEAEVFAASGFTDIVVAYPVHGEEKWQRLAELARNARIVVNADNHEAVRGLSAAADATGTVLGVQIEIDSGFHRCGIPAEDIDAVEALARLVLALPGLDFDGVTTHRGIFFEGGSAISIDEAGRTEGAIVVGVAEQLRERGIDVREVTAGGTISGHGVAEVAGITEVRAGTYVFNDLMQVGFGSAALDDLALSIHCTVISTHVEGQATIDAGSKTFSGDRGVVGAATSAPAEIARAVDSAIVLDRISEEHGMLHLNGEHVALGDRLAFFPAHACTAVNLSDEVFGVRDGVVEFVWPIRARGKRT
jgi:D-serine deaminase-like pyridoxal phosphate-dependent protein